MAGVEVTLVVRRFLGAVLSLSRREHPFRGARHISMSCSPFFQWLANTLAASRCMSPYAPISSS